VGSWGTGPFDSDDAGDLIAKFRKPVERVASARGDASYHYQEARSVIPFLVLSHATDILGGPSLEPSLLALCRMRRDVEWLSGWKSPTRIARALEKEITEVWDRMQRCRGCARSVGRAGFKVLGLLVLEAVESPVPRRRESKSRASRRAAKRRISKRRK